MNCKASHSDPFYTIHILRQSHSIIHVLLLHPVEMKPQDMPQRFCLHGNETISGLIEVVNA